MNSGASPELRALVEEHRRRLRRLISDHAEFLTRLETEAPTLVDREAAAVERHSFYTGVEFILRAIADAFDGAPSKSGDWHAELLRSATGPSPTRPRVLAAQTAESLRDFLVFRHRFRNLYGFELDWMLMSPLLRRMPATLRQFEGDLDVFLASCR